MHRGTQQPPSPKALADRARREAMPDTRDNTGRLLGDPPAGRSALEQKMQAELRRQLGLGEGQDSEWLKTPYEDAQDGQDGEGR